ncbi:protein FAM110C [Spinachia spinachia]
MEAISGTTKILEKGPDYLRKQMELESETKGRMSAVERLAATKLKYVKSKPVANSTQEPVTGLGSASVSSTGSSNRSSKRGENVCVGANSRSATLITRSPGPVCRSSSKKRRDSLLFYRQKCELLTTSANDRKHHVTRKLLFGSVHKRVPLPDSTQKECEGECNIGNAIPPEGTERRRNGAAEGHSTENSNAGKKVTTGSVRKSCLLTVPEFEKRSGKAVGRSHSDISSRYSKSFADFDGFFKYCGLGGEVIESLGKENFSARSDESVSAFTSENCFSRNSAESDGLLEDELREKTSQGTSVIERNARVIKWLYSCKNAVETGKKLRDLD